MLPVVEAARDLAVVSVDTYRPEVARAVIEAGAGVDQRHLRPAGPGDGRRGGRHRRHAGHHAQPGRAAHACTRRPPYGDVTAEVAAFLRQRVELALSRGVRPEQIIVDPGHDLNKNTYHSLELTRRLDEIAAIGYPMLAAVSNKDFIGETLDAAQHGPAGRHHRGGGVLHPARRPDRPGARRAAPRWTRSG